MPIHCIFKGYVHTYTYVLYLYTHNYIAYAVYKCTVCIFMQMCAYAVYTVEQWFSTFFISQHSELSHKMIEAHHQYLRKDLIIYKNGEIWSFKRVGMIKMCSY